MSDELERRIQEALDAGLSPEETDLAAELRSDPEAARVASELRAVDEWLREWGAARRPEPGGSVAERVEARLDEALPPLAHDPLAPPVFDDDPGDVERAAPAARAPAAVEPSTPMPAPVDLATRRPGSRAGWWVAAAAAAGLVVSGVAMLRLRSGAAPEELAMSAPSQAAGPEAVRPAPGSAREAAREAASEPLAGLSFGPEVDRELAEEAAADEAGQGAAVARAAAPAAPEAPMRSARPRRRARRRPVRGGLHDVPASLDLAPEPAAAPPPSPRSGTAGAARASVRARLRACFGADAPATLELTAVVDPRTEEVAEVRLPAALRATPDVRECVRRAVARERLDTAARVVRLRYRLGGEGVGDTAAGRASMRRTGDVP